MKRRNLILSGLGITGALIVGWGVLPARSRTGKPDNMLPTEDEVALNGWIKIAKDGGVVLAMHRSDMGQGIHNALSMLVAEELNVPLKQIRLEQAGHDSIYGNVSMFVGTLPFHPLQSEGADKPFAVHSGEWIVGKVARELGVNATGGSSSVKDAWEHLRMAAATAKASLLLAAAEQWKVPLQEIKVKEGVMSHASGKSAHFGEFARIYQSFVNMNECLDSNTIGTNSVFNFCLENNIKLRLKTVIGLGDKLFDHYKNNIQQAFGCKIHETYGSSEGFQIGFQSDLDYMYLYTPQVYMELLDDNNNPVVVADVKEFFDSITTQYFEVIENYSSRFLAIKSKRKISDLIDL